jgi:hypothetical protein
MNGPEEDHSGDYLEEGERERLAWNARRAMCASELCSMRDIVALVEAETSARAAAARESADVGGDAAG